MPEALITCAEARDIAERRRRAVLANLTGKALEKELADADKAVEEAANRHDCI